MRGGPRQFVYSKIMSWVALDRSLRLADKRSFPADRARWLKVRDEIYEEVMARGWNAERKAFVQSYDTDALDASMLADAAGVLHGPQRSADAEHHRRDLSARSRRAAWPPTAWCTVTIPAPRSTICRAAREHSTCCSFWLVEALTRAGNTDPQRLEEARLLFEQMLGYANHLGLYAEQTGPSGEALGNFPQAFTHLSLISAAFNLDRALDQGRPGRRL